MLNLNTVSKLTTGAEVNTTVKLVIGSKTNDAGKASNVYASFTVKGARLLSLADIVAHLNAMDQKTAISIRLPRVDLSTRISVSLKTLYAPATLAAVLSSMHSEDVSANAPADVIPLPTAHVAEDVSAAANAPVEPTTTEEIAPKGRKGRGSK